MVTENEHFSRWVYNPRFINDAGEVNDRFITLRSHLNEEGISGQLFDRLPIEDVIESGQKFIRKTSNGTPKETLSHIAKAEVGNIVHLALGTDKIRVEEVPSEHVPQHAEIKFDVVDNASTNSAKMYYYFEKIKDEMLKELIPVALE